jgi:hypothetical protein
MRGAFTFVELSHDTFTLFINDVLFSILENHLGIFCFVPNFHMCVPVKKNTTKSSLPRA